MQKILDSWIWESGFGELRTEPETLVEQNVLVKVKTEQSPQEFVLGKTEQFPQVLDPRVEESRFESKILDSWVWESGFESKILDLKSVRMNSRIG